MRNSLSKLANSTWTWVAGLILILLVFISVSLSNDMPSETFEVRPGTNFLFDWTGSDWMFALFKNNIFRLFLPFVAILLISLTVQLLSADHKVIRTRSYFPFFFSCLFSSVLVTHFFSADYLLACLLFCFAVYVLFISAGKDNSVGTVFDASFLLAIASLFMHKIAFLLPVFWLVMAILQSLSFKNLMSSLFGFLSVFWLLGGISFLVGDFRYLDSFQRELLDLNFLDINAIPAAGQVFCVIQIFLSLIASYYFLANQNLDKLTTRNNVFSILLLLLSIAALCLFPGKDFEGLLLLFLSFDSILLSYYFSLGNGIIMKVFFIICIISSLVTFLLY